MNHLRMKQKKRRSTFCRPTRTCIGHDSSLLPIMKWINKGDGLWDLTCLRNCKLLMSYQRWTRVNGNPSLSLITLPNKMAHCQLRSSSYQRKPLKNGLWDANDWELQLKSVQKSALKRMLLTMTTRITMVNKNHNCAKEQATRGRRQRIMLKEYLRGTEETTPGRRCSSKILQEKASQRPWRSRSERNHSCYQASI